MSKWLENEVLPKAVKCQGFGSDVEKFLGFEVDAQNGMDQYASEVIFGTAFLENSAGEKISEAIVIKVQVKISTDAPMDFDAQFYNELLFYSEVLPLLQKYDTENILRDHFPKFIYGVATLGERVDEDVLIFKSLCPDGFRLTEDRVFLDPDHINLALEKIAKFHALTYLCRQDDPEGLSKVVSKIRETHKEVTMPDGTDVLWQSTKRGIDPLKNDPEYKDRLEDICNHCINSTKHLTRYILPSQPLSVVCHGDFNRNNMMFKYDSSGKPIDVAFFDLATIKYCSPVIDVSFFLIMNTLPETKTAHWDEFIHVYYEALTGRLGEHPEKPTFQELDKDFKLKGIYGYYLSSFFLPIMIGESPTEKTEFPESGAEFAEIVSNLGGPPVTEMLTRIVKHMIDSNFVFEA